MIEDATSNAVSLMYKTARAVIKRGVYAKQEIYKKPRDLEEAVEIGDKLLKKIPKFLYSFGIPEGIGVQFHDLYFQSPLTIASFKEDIDVVNLWLQTGFGGACLKTVMHQNEGNKRPRLQEIKINNEYCLLNSMGLPSNGIEKFIGELKKSQIFSSKKPTGISIGGSTLEEYMMNFLELDKYFSNANHRIYYEINASCPNTIYGLQLSENPRFIDGLLFLMRCVTKTVIGVKFSPDMDDDVLLEYAKMLKKHSKTYINLGNTSYRKCSDLGLPETEISTAGGGLSGGALYERTFEMAKLIAPVGIPIIATGGINSAERVKSILAMGMEHKVPILVGVATAVVEDICFAQRVNRELYRASKQNTGV
ncbi:MAG TPA: hypothetical protein VI894_02705 [Candidatus Nanoarchaeia archaeon]|nr:hypothetical protein [Candidatus Nanoarchaeia archaeon]